MKLSLRFGGLALLAVTSAAHGQGDLSNPQLAATVNAKAASALLAEPWLEHNPYAVLVRFDPRSSNEVRGLARSFTGATKLRGYDLVPGLELVSTGGRSPEAMVAALSSMPGVLYAEPDVVMRTDQNQRFPINTNFYPYQWGMHNEGQNFNGKQATAGADVNAPEAWYVRTGDPNFAIAVIDTGVQYWRTKIDDNIWANPGEVAGNGIDDDGNGYVDDIRGWDFSVGDNDPLDENGHGTHVAGIIGAEEGLNTGVVGMMWDCKIMMLRFLDENGSGYMSNAALAVQYAVQKGAKVSNNSYGYGTSTSGQSLYDVIQAAGNYGHIFVASAGNDNRNIDGKTKHYPAGFNLPNIITVAATDMEDQRAWFSNYGQTSVDIGAPGVYILSLYLQDWAGPNTYQRYMNGTSMAAPHVTGTVGLVYAENPTWTHQQVKSRILSTARPIPSLANLTVTGGGVDAGAALGNAGPPPPSPPAAPGTPVITKLGGLQVKITWADSSNNENDFVVARETKSGNTWINPTTLPPVAANSTSTTDTLPAAGTYRYRVQARNGAGSSAWTLWVQIRL